MDKIGLHLVSVTETLKECKTTLWKCTRTVFNSALHLISVMLHLFGIAAIPRDLHSFYLKKPQQSVSSVYESYMKQADETNFFGGKTKNYITLYLYGTEHTVKTDRLKQPISKGYNQ